MIPHIVSEQTDSNHANHSQDIRNRASYDERIKDSIIALVPSEGDISSHPTTVKHQPNKKNQNTYNYEEVNYYTGDMPYKNYYGKGVFDKSSLSKLTFVNSSFTDAVVLLCNVNGQVIRHNYIKKNITFTMPNIPSGTYIIKVMFGNSWNPKKNNGENFPTGGFMKNVSFIKSMDNDSFNFVPDKTCDGVIYPTYSVTLHKVQNGNLRTDEISKSDFFN